MAVDNSQSQRRVADHPGGVAVPGAVQAGGPGIHLRQKGAGGQAHDPGVLPSGTGRGAAQTRAGSGVHRSDAGCISNH